MSRLRPCGLRLEYLEDRSVPATFIVTTTADEVGSPVGKRSLRDAITAANNHAGPDLIVVPKGTFAISIGGTFENDKDRKSVV